MAACYAKCLLLTKARLKADVMYFDVNNFEQPKAPVGYSCGSPVDYLKGDHRCPLPVKSTQPSDRKCVNICEGACDMKRLYRSKSDVMIAGVCSGLAKYLDVDPTAIRLAFVLLLFLALGGFWIYVILWIVMPVEPAAGTESVEVEAKPKPESPKLVEAPKPAAAKKTGTAKSAGEKEK